MSDPILDYIASSPLAAPEGPLLLSDEDLPQPQGTEAQGVVVDSNLLTYAEGTPVEVKNTVAAWLLYAQRVANARVPKSQDDPQGWVDAYYDTLMRSGWVGRGGVGAWNEDNVFGTNVHHNILAFLTVALGPAAAALAIVTAAITSLDDMDKDSPWITLFDTRGRSARTVGFTVGNCVEADAVNGGAALDCVDFAIDAQQVMTQVLFFTFTKKTAKMARRRVVLELSPDALTRYGPAIKAKVDADVLASIAAFPLAEA